MKRDLNNKEKSNLKQVKELNFAYELKFMDDRFGGGYYVNIPKITEMWCLNSIDIQDRLTKNNLNNNQTK